MSNHYVVVLIPGKDVLCTLGKMGLVVQKLFAGGFAAMGLKLALTDRG